MQTTPDPYFAAVHLLRANDFSREIERLVDAFHDCVRAARDAGADFVQCAEGIDAWPRLRHDADPEWVERHYDRHIAPHA